MAKSKSNLAAPGRNGKRPGRAPRAPQSLEDAIVALAESGKLAGAARAAIRDQRAAGLPITYKRGNEIVKEYPDGRLEVIGTLPPATYKLPKGVRRIRNGG